MRLVLLSDTHGLHDALEVPAGDVLVHAGDCSTRGRPDEIEAFGAWFQGQPHAHKVFVAGNHDFLFQTEPRRARELLGPVHYLQDAGLELEGLSIWGSPWQPWFHDWAFNLPRGEPLAERWRQVPAGVDLLVTHGPPLGILDRTALAEDVGCEALRAELERIRPAVHVFGHIHEARGTLQTDPTLFVNASICDLRYRPVHAPIVLERTAGTFALVP
jgi:predicted phosphodiesterase